MRLTFSHVSKYEMLLVPVVSALDKTEHEIENRDLGTEILSSWH